MIKTNTMVNKGAVGYLVPVLEKSIADRNLELKVKVTKVRNQPNYRRISIV
mgnify:CR=1 FL=1